MQVNQTAGAFPINKQNEPSIAQYPTNPNHLVAGSNDEIGESLCTTNPSTSADACPFAPNVNSAGFYASFDGGQTCPTTCQRLISLGSFGEFHVSRHLRLHRGKLGILCLEQRQRRLLVVEPQGFLPLLLRLPPLREQVVPQPAALLQLTGEEALLFLRRVETVQERLARTNKYSSKAASCHMGERPFIPA